MLHIHKVATSLIHAVSRYYTSSMHMHHFQTRDSHLSYENSISDHIIWSTKDMMGWRSNVIWIVPLMSKEPKHFKGVRRTPQKTGSINVNLLSLFTKIKRNSPSPRSIPILHVSKRITPSPFLVAYKRPKNLKDLLLRATLKPPQQTYEGSRQ